MNPYFYLFYKLNRFLNKKGNNEWGPIAAITFFTGQYIGIIYIKINSVIEKDFDEHKTVLIIIFGSIFVLNTILFLNKRRVQNINERFQSESKTSKKIGGFLVILYIVFSVGLILFG